MNFLKSLVKKENKDRKFLEKELNRLEKNLTNFKQISTISNINKSFKIYILKKLMEYKSGVNVTGTGMEKSQLNSFWIFKSIAQPKATSVPLYQTKRN